MESVERVTVLWPVGPCGYGNEQVVLASEFDRVAAERNSLRDEVGRLARLFDDLSKRVGFSEERCQQTGESPGDCADVLRADLDRVTAERDALQLMLNDLEEQNPCLEQRRHAEQQAREAAERRVMELESERAALREALLIYSGQHERSDKVGHIEMLDIAHAALNGSARKPEQSGRPIVAWALTFNGEFNSGWISAGASKASAEGMRDNYISVCRPCNLPKLALVPLTTALNPTAEAESHE